MGNEGLSGSRQRRREERSRHGVEAAVNLARENGLRVEEPIVLNDLFSLMVHLKPAPVVARVATCMPKLLTLIEAWLEREISVTAFLSGRGAPVVPPSPELPPGPHEYDGFPISFWQYVEPDPDKTPTASDCSAMIADLHAALKSYPGELPRIGADVIPPAMKTIHRDDDVLSEAEVNLIRASAERPRAFWEEPDGQVQPKLPVVKVEKDYVLKGPDGEATLLDMLSNEPWDSIKMPTLVMDGGASEGWIRNRASQLAEILPNSRHITLEGQDRGPADDVLAPVLVEFFR